MYKWQSLVSGMLMCFSLPIKGIISRDVCIIFIFIIIFYLYIHTHAIFYNISQNYIRLM